ncbi:hypothetical protein Q1695_005954 [Nippostrongylus brasiliensis]|nr:hypothetical protein Q1695_005954 [Nippostrongylus brasiliensis]
MPTSNRLCINWPQFHNLKPLRFPYVSTTTTSVWNSEVPHRVYALAVLLALIPLVRHFGPILMGWNEPPYEDNDDTRRMNLKMKFLIEPQLEDGLKMLVMVNSMPNRFRERQLIRESWAMKDLYNEQTTKVLFLSGRPKSEEMHEALANEEARYHDVVVADVDEGYYSLSLKTYAMLYFKHTRAPTAKCLVKADSDNVLLVRNFERLCEETSTFAVQCA